MYAKISKKGQVTIPKPIRQRLNIEKEGGVLFLVEDNDVKLKGVPGAQANLLAGSLKKYAKEYVLLNGVRKKIKGKIADEVAAEGISD
ncbi:MAG: AbrB/MazE/SpoVT family DNA-binding domain-containing protein [Deltaproteobacteria bacterium]|nr:AbrB/MazE/SpoVT family DNA-binding domain-containing protein [Deltaproteobacteria bacterium]MBW1736941.1 AbrB/MazE/SpoVT family DNA-binding domain-containing protein [Deltaproteobacteria bacterium]MBW1910142.1 AbrB/MazE/SpoVT family DNA-binding domain-containing protein [Deltaproteobacteria bacterium]MBW2034087.1 AbrB/MazE/SpoVT family DNA-binding domain-containing protein [Deltaproteobacteria bacterium]MBW2114456.1 AbrB/MazE/SpoVT family DNA-binding domain-containing protein [Deltaproteobac